MRVRRATTGDRAAIRDVAERSFRASYALSPDQIATIVEESFSDDALRTRLDDPTVVMFVAERDDDVVGFADVERDGGVTLHWLHVHPDARGEGAGTALIERVRTDAAGRGSPGFTAQVLDAATDGGNFLERFGLNRSDSGQWEAGEEALVTAVYTASGEEHEANEPAVPVPERVDAGGESRPVDRDEPIPGTDAPFFQLYTNTGRTETYGYFCSNCGETDVSVDGLDRIECGNCGNMHLADEWDAAYL